MRGKNLGAGFGKGRSRDTTDESFIHLLNRQLLSVYYIAGKTPDAADAAGTKQNPLLSWNLNLSEGK